MRCAAVTNRASDPCWIALYATAIPTCVFPVPDGP